MASHRVLTIVGARPQFIKAAAISRVIADRPGLQEIMVHTGQHFDREMSALFFEELTMPTPAFNLGIGGGPHGAMTGRMIEAVEGVIEAERPDCVLVYGDTNSTLAGALAGAKLQVPVGHVEAGLRSFNRRMPEEINRVLTDHVSDLLFCPTGRAVGNLALEGITRGVHAVGDVMYDVCRRLATQAAGRGLILERLGVEHGNFSLATLHRAENTDDDRKLSEILQYLREQATERPIVFPLHPRTKKAMARAGHDVSGLILCPPVSYGEMAELLNSTATVFTDSGGLQKEAYFFRRPCVTLRDETEWVETIEAGWNRLWQGPDYLPRKDITDYGDGHAAEKIVELLVRHLDASP